jgi:hypothetical protein
MKSLLTGISGTGKSTVIRGCGRADTAVDADEPGWSVPGHARPGRRPGEPEWVQREDGVQGFFRPRMPRCCS